MSIKVKPKVAYYVEPKARNSRIKSVCKHCGHGETSFVKFATEASMRQVLQENAFPWKCPKCKTVALSAMDLFKEAK
jgi:hypothetical protein